MSGIYEKVRVLPLENSISESVTKSESATEILWECQYHHPKLGTKHILKVLY